MDPNHMKNQSLLSCVIIDIIISCLIFCLSRASVRIIFISRAG